MITTILKLLLKKNIYNETIGPTKVILESRLTQNCIKYMEGKCFDKDFIQLVENLAQNMNMSKYEVLEYILDRQERKDLSK